MLTNQRWFFLLCSIGQFFMKCLPPSLLHLSCKRGEKICSEHLRFVPRCSRALFAQSFVIPYSFMTSILYFVAWFLLSGSLFFLFSRLKNFPRQFMLVTLFFTFCSCLICSETFVMNAQSLFVELLYIIP